MMKGMLKRALGVAAAAAMAVAGMGVLAGTANAAPLTGDQTITLKADNREQLEGRTFTVYKLADYVQYGTGDGAEYGIDTIDGIDGIVEGAVRDAVNAAVNPDVDDKEDPLATVISRNSGEGSLDQDLKGSTRTFVKNLDITGFTKFIPRSDVFAGDDENGYTRTLTVDPGIYVIYDTTDPAVNNAVPMLIGTAPVYKDTEIDMKNQSKPGTPTKTVTGDKDDTVSFGDTLTFTVTASAPDTANYEDYTFTFADTPSLGLTVNSEGMTINGKTIGIGTGQVNAKVSFTGTFQGDGKQSFTVTLEKAALAQAQAGADNGQIVLSYTATVNSSATASGVSNSVTVNNNGIVSDEAKTPDLYYNDFAFHKQYADGTPADTAEFVIKDESGKYLVRNADGTWSTADTQAGATKLKPSDGLVSVKGLRNGEYTVEEVTAADGAMDIKPSFTVTLKHGTATPTAFADTAESDPFGLVNFNEDKTVATVTNVKKVTQLPMTGAAGTMLFTVLGLLIAGAGVTVYMKSRSMRHMLRG
ncbi:isopeptide-forming domain-containing fimbrial protein [Bifidobacterium pullorum subsp. saeculare]|uniref:isopeptide-forming domain-containing fimbrial protein n=1 Tax=Bifidobacterium pullorum TaxID=78448 RepID=UPI00195C17CF|nr:isopeptide-forming domain-containing fimbrial protein [Bifidobacterium pullorum]MBM6730578.1 isopeptide-forming domain-containing fimbrial protein [Bifidobacterium pullorum subsp. saeculare]